MIKIFQFTDRGSRENNEDSIKTFENPDFTAACVADGVGGQKCGKLASETVVEFFAERVESFETDLQNIINKAHERVKSLQNENLECKSMATTFTGCMINGLILKGIHIGDSRLCILRGNGIKQLTESHTEVIRLVKNKKLRIEDVETYPRKHILESAIGVNGELLVQRFEFNLEVADRILLTSDGVHDIITKVEFRDLSKKTSEIKKFGDSIIKLLSQKKIQDNISFIILELQ